MQKSLGHWDVNLCTSFVMLKTQASKTIQGTIVAYKNPSHSWDQWTPTETGLCYWTIGGYTVSCHLVSFPMSPPSPKQTRQVATDAARISLAIKGGFRMVRGNDEAKSLDPGQRRNMWAWLDDSNIFKYKKRRFICPFEVPKTCCNCERRSK